MINFLFMAAKIVLGVIVLVALLVAIALTVRCMIAMNTRKKHAIVSSKGIDEEVNISIGGIQQYLYIRGENQQNPVMLFLHGGPGGTMTSVLHAYQYEWEQDYTVVNWDQRVSGKTYFLNVKDSRELANQLTTEQLLDDLNDIISYLCKRFGQEKILLTGHSWGTVLGSQYILRHPDNIQSFIGISQTISVNDGIVAMGRFLLAMDAVKGSPDDIAAINECLTRVRASKEVANNEALELYRVTGKYMSVDMNTTVFLKALFTSPYYTLRELTYYAKQEEMAASLTHYLLNYDLRDCGYDYKVPVIYIMGERDWHNRIITKEYFDRISAPSKQFVFIDNAGHVPMLDQPKTFYTAMHKALRTI